MAHPARGPFDIRPNKACGSYSGPNLPPSSSSQYSCQDQISNHDTKAAGAVRRDRGADPGTNPPVSPVTRPPTTSAANQTLRDGRSATRHRQQHNKNRMRAKLFVGGEELWWHYGRLKCPQLRRQAAPSDKAMCFLCIISCIVARLYRI